MVDVGAWGWGRWSMGMGSIFCPNGLDCFSLTPLTPPLRLPTGFSRLDCLLLVPFLVLPPICLWDIVVQIFFVLVIVDVWNTLLPLGFFLFETHTCEIVFALVYVSMRCHVYVSMRCPV